MGKHISTLIKVAVTIAGLAYVVWQVPLSSIRAALVDVRWGWILVCFMLMNVSLVVRAFRWRLLLRGLGVPVRFRRLVELYFVGGFFNILLPSGFGGDVVRVVEAAHDVPRTVAAGTVIVDRMLGLMALFLMALLAMPFRPPDFPPPLLVTITAVSVVGLLGGFVLLEGRLIRRVGRWLPAPLAPRGDGPLARLVPAIQGFGRHAVRGALTVSVLFNFMLVGWWIAAGLALNLDVPTAHYFLVVPILSVALLIPSIGGLGLRESLAPTLFAGAGLTSAQAIAISLVVFAVTRLSGLLGAPIYVAMTLRQHRARALAQAETAADGAHGR